MSDLFVATFEGTQLEEVPAIADGDDSQNKDTLDELALDESRTYKQKISKYIRSALACVKEALFFGLMLVGHTCREPLLHHYRFLCKKLCPTSMPIVDLVTHHIGTICSEFDDLVSSLPNWTIAILTQLEDFSKCSPMTQEDRIGLVLSSLSILLHNAGAFDRRIVKQFARPVFSFQLAFN